VFCTFNKVLRQQIEAGNRKKPTLYSNGTGTGVMRRHLYDHHLDLWVPACDKLNISITAKEAQARVTEYRQRHGQTCPTDAKQPEMRRKFSSTGFVDAIMEFIVADDQVGTAVFLLSSCHLLNIYF
jgi:hypothetical protein